MFQTDSNENSYDDLFFKKIESKVTFIVWKKNQFIHFSIQIKYVMGGQISLN